jgi:hypothetical protein
MTRLQTYRAFLAAMSPSSNPSEALARGFYVEPPGGGVWSDLTRRLELEPASTHLVLGGIGSGKTSELLRARAHLLDALRETGDLVWYCDVSRYHDLASPAEPGVLFALTGNLLVHAAKRTKAGIPEDSEVAEAAKSLRELAHGHWVEVPEYDGYGESDDPDEYTDRVFLDGLLRPPNTKPIDWRIRAHVEDMMRLLAHHPGEGRASIVLFDSLDRLPDPASFKVLVEDDIRALKSAGVGVVVVGPVRFIVGRDRSLTDLFDRVHYQLASDPQTASGREFLCEVLRRRAQPSGLLPEECLPALAEASGGVLRDLIALAKRSAEEAYAAGHPTITLQDVASASEAFGRSLALGLDDDQIKILKAVAESGAFVVRGERELSLLETRRVLLYPGNRWVVHPTLEGLIAKIPELAG